MRLKIFKYLEECILHNRHAPIRGLRHADISEYSKASEIELKIQTVIDYRLQFGARIPVAKGDERRGRKEVIRMLANEIYEDIYKEVYELRDWVFENGVGRDVESKLTRILQLLEGEDVEAEHQQKTMREDG